ncbi:AraC family transcriptional regulator [Paenibacillus sp.]|uniref:AraC family transcriptional regulator n=1 Tax=Paenibacillus sp. TaxID=58172 RepID=UPI00281219CA|nr:AraC family transcriptional regulator [Paenibacillus sp.]
MEDLDGRMRLHGTKEVHVLPDVRTTFQLFAAHLRRVDAPWSYPPHAHAMFELNVVTEGLQRFSIESKTHEQRAGDIAIVRPGERHAATADDGDAMAYFCLHFQADDPSLRRSLHALDRGLYPQGSEVERRIGPAISRLIELATAEADAESAALRMRTLSAVYALLAALAEEPEPERRNEGKPAGAAARLAEAIASRIERSVAEGADGEAEDDAILRIARSLGYSPSHCARVFREAYGMSPRAYRSAVTLREAKLLLLDPFLSVEAIAAKLGYADPATFSKQFRRWTGMSPREYRT